MPPQTQMSLCGLRCHQGKVTNHMAQCLVGTFTGAIPNAVSTRNSQEHIKVEMKPKGGL